MWLALLIQATGSFKERGARNALLKLSPEAKKLGVVVASAGNHALALAHHGAKLGIPVTVVMPSVRAARGAQPCFVLVAFCARCGDRRSARVKQQ